VQKYTMKDYFKIDGIGGFLVAVVGLVVVAVVLWTLAVFVQQDQSQNYYSIDSDINVIKSQSDNQQKYLEQK